MVGSLLLTQLQTVYWKEVDDKQRYAALLGSEIKIGQFLSLFLSFRWALNPPHTYIHTDRQTKTDRQTDVIFDSFLTCSSNTLAVSDGRKQEGYITYMLTYMYIVHGTCI